MKAIIEVDVPDYQIGQEVSIYFKDTMMKKGVVQEPCDDAISRQAVLDQTYDWSKDEFLRVTDPFDYLRKRINSIPLVKQESKWIPVSERLPEWDIECLVVDDKGEFGVGFYRDDPGAWDSPSWGWLERKDDVDNYDAYYMPCGIGKIVAWMPLPEPYKPQESEE